MQLKTISLPILLSELGFSKEQKPTRNVKELTGAEAAEHGEAGQRPPSAAWARPTR